MTSAGSAACSKKPCFALLFSLAAVGLLTFHNFLQINPLQFLRKLHTECIQSIDNATFSRPISATDAWLQTLDEEDCGPVFGSLTMVYNKTYGVCTTLEGKQIIWVFWDYTPMPAYINLSIEALKCHNRDYAHVELVTDKNFRTFAKDAKFPIHRAFDTMIEAHKADYFRCVVLLKYGGFYTDADMVHWNSLRPWFEKLQEGFDIFGYKWPGEIIGITLMGPMKPARQLMRYWLHDAHLLLDAKLPAFRFQKLVDYPLGWAEMLRNVLQPRMHQLVAESRVKYFSIDGPPTIGLLQQTQIDRDLFKPLTFNNERQIATINASQFPIFVYHNSGQAMKWKQMTNVTEFIQTNVVLVRLLNMSMERCKK